MRKLLNRGTNGNLGYTPYEGRRQVSVRGALAAEGVVLDATFVWVASLAVGAVAVAVGLALAGYTLGNVWVVAILAIAAALAERGRVRLNRYMEESISLIPTLFAAIVLGPLAAMVVASASMLGALPVGAPSQGGGRLYLKWVNYTATRALTGAMTGLTAAWAADLATTHAASVIIATTVGALVSQLLDVFFALATLAVRRTGNPRELLRTHAPLVLLAVPLYAPLVAMLVFAYEDVSPFTVPLFLAPALAAQRLFGLYRQERELGERLMNANSRLARANLSFASALVATLDARDRYTAGHSAAVAIYARDIAQRMNLGNNQVELVHLCGLVHDIGKIGLPPGLLEKPGALTLDERRQMQEHSAIGERILANVEDYAEIATIVRHHHERMDGMGYPDGVIGNDIPLLSRIIAVADAYNAMTSDRPYRDAMPSRVARMRLAQGVEGQFDTSVVAAFEAILAGASEDYREARGADFTITARTEYPTREASEAAA
jgi:putative nucleotidyltransferase with HDIG domain